MAQRSVDAVFSYAGRTAQPVPQPLPTRIGGFGGISGLLDYIKAEGISHIVDATHPFAARMSLNALAASQASQTPLLVLERPAWTAGPGDDWQHVPDLAAAVAGLPDTPSRVFLAIGKQNLHPFAAAPQHHYLLRLVDPPTDTTTDLPLRNAVVVVARGPFDVQGDTALLQAHGISHIVAKNAGGSGAEAKLLAARSLGVKVILIDRPNLPARQVVASVDEVLAWLGHNAERGV